MFKLGFVFVFFFNLCFNWFFASVKGLKTTLLVALIILAPALSKTGLTTSRYEGKQMPSGQYHRRVCCF